MMQILHLTAIFQNRQALIRAAILKFSHLYLMKKIKTRKQYSQIKSSKNLKNCKCLKITFSLSSQLP